METLEAALQEVENIPAYLPNCLQLQDVLDKARSWLQEAEALQVGAHSSLIRALCGCVLFVNLGMSVLPARGSDPCAGQPL